MTSFVSITLQSVSYQLPDGRVLFSELNAQFDGRPTGLVGRNGSGKSMLARILAGELTPTTGRCARTGTAHYLTQQISPRPGQTVADLVGVKPIIDALIRIENGSTLQDDFDAVGERWDIHQRLQQELATNQLGHLSVSTSATSLSGGELMKVSLIGAFLSGADLLILDEPSNHLDRENRNALADQLQLWPNGLIVVSHDRSLLESMSRIVELSSLGLHSYGGGYSFYATAKDRERAHALELLEQRKTERRREQQELSEQREKLERRQNRGARRASNANQAPILLGRQKERSEFSSGKLRAKQDEAHAALSLRVREAAGHFENDVPIVLLSAGAVDSTPEKTANLEHVVLPYLTGCSQRINLKLSKAQRIGLLGPNGSGKSTLLKLLAGHTLPLSGQCEVFVETAYLDQHLSILDAEKSILDQMLAVYPLLGESVLRTRLALLGLDADRVLLPTRLLSGGEKLKGALARALYSERPAQLLLLDEPSNHLDLTSIQALESMLSQYHGTILVASHDEAFLASIALTHRLEVTQRGWSMTEW